MSQQQKMSRISCSICYDFVSSDSILLHLDCGHIYHDNCLSQWFKTSRTCPDCRKLVTTLPSRVYPNFDESDEDETLQLATNIEILENKNRLLEEQLTQLHLDQHKKIITQLAEKTYEVMRVTNTMKLFEQLYCNVKTKNEELIKSNDEVSERLELCLEKLDTSNDLLSSQQNESMILSSKIMDLEKKLQFAESDAEMDKYFKNVAINEKNEAIEQLNDTQRQLFYAQNTIDRNFVQINTILCELERMRTEKQLQTIRMKQIEETICERDMGRREIELENVQLKSKLKEIMSQGTVSSFVAQKRKYTNDCCNNDLVNDNIRKSNGCDTTESDRPPIKLIIRKMNRDANFQCVPVL